MSTHEEVEEEIASIEAILPTGLTIDRNGIGIPTRILMVCSPLVASEEDRSYVGLTLIVNITDHYPDTEPIIEIRNPRGLDENDVNSLKRHLVDICTQYVGGPVVFQLIDACQEFLTEKNVPACPCAICLRHIVGEDDFVKTVCFHYFHSLCFGRYVQNFLDFPSEDTSKNNNLSCPVCRGNLPIVEKSELDKLLKQKTPTLEEEEAEFTLTRELKDLQTKMSRLYLKQKEAGGIIDIEAEAKKFLIITTPDGGEDQPGPASRLDPPPLAPKPVTEQPKKCKGGSGLGKRRDYGEKKRNFRRKN